MEQVRRDHKMHGDYRYGGGGTVTFVAVVVAHHEYNCRSGAGNTHMVSEAHVWWNIYIF